MKQKKKTNPADLVDKLICTQLKTLMETTQELKVLTWRETKTYVKGLIDSYLFPIEEDNSSADECKNCLDKIDFLGNSTMTDDVTQGFTRSLQPIDIDQAYKYESDLFRSIENRAKSGPISANGKMEMGTIKLFSVSAGSIARFPMATYDSKVHKNDRIKRLKSELRFMGHHSKTEPAQLKYLNREKKTKFVLNEKLYFYDGINATPDAVMFKDKQLDMVAEFKNHPGKKLSELSKITPSSKKQLKATMRATGAKTGYLVVHCKEGDSITTVTLSPSDNQGLDQNVTHFADFTKDPNISRAEWKAIFGERKRLTLPEYDALKK